METIANLLSHPICFISVFILGISALFSIIGTITVSTMAILQVHTADHINTLSKNVSDTLFTQ